MSEAVQTTNDEELSRRGIIKLAVGGVGLAYAAAVGYPIYRYLNSPVEKSAEMAAIKEVTLKDADKLPVGTAMVFKFGVRPALLIHHEDQSWVALDAVCTHMACTVAYDPAQTKIVCACHGGVYDAKTGDALEGPPPRGLTRFDVTVTQGSVTIRRPEA